MESHKLPNYLRGYRKRAGFSQREVAFLLGCQDGHKASRYELQIRKPNLETILAYELIFGTPARELFAGIYAKVESEVTERSRVLAGKLSAADADRTTVRKLQRLRAMTSPLESRPLNNGSSPAQ